MAERPLESVIASDMLTSQPDAAVASRFLSIRG